MISNKTLPKYEKLFLSRWFTFGGVSNMVFRDIKFIQTSQILMD